jgi:DNA modification methylase
MKVESTKISALVLDPANARTHGPDNLEAIKGSLARFGQQKPIVVGKNGVVIAGNGTLEAARSLGWDKINIVKTELEGSEATAFALADNRTSELAAWNDEILTATLKALSDEGFPIADIGFKDFDFSVPPEPLTGEDEVPENVETRCKPGDLWILGNHRLLCGDSTNVQHFERLMGSEKADMVYTDPPYGMHLDTDYSTMVQKDGRKGNIFRKVIGDDQPFDPRFQFELFKDARDQFWFGADYYCEHLPKGGSWLVWDKRESAATGSQVSEKMFGSMFELCWSMRPHKRDIARIMWAGGLGEGMTEARKGRNNALDRVHPTQKPVLLAEFFFERWGKPDDLVVDLFLGSGSTLIACEKTNRRCFGMEIDPKYCDVILTRWEAYTGKTAELSPAEAPNG